MKDLFGIEIQEPKRPPVNKTAMQMHADLLKIHGEYPDKCKNCQHFYVRQMSGRYFKCKQASTSGNPKTDWRANWKACGKFVLQVDEEVIDIPGRSEKFNQNAFDAEQDFIDKKAGRK